MARTITGRVSSDKPDKTIVVSVASRKTHPIYKKQYTKNTKYMAHDEANQAKIGDIVLIKETRPMSARKRFTLEKILETNSEVFTETDAAAGVEEFTQPKAENAENAPEVEAKSADEKPKKEAK